MYVYKLFKGKNSNLIYLADRWFQNYKLMKYMDELDVTYCIRIKSNLTFYIYDYGEIAGNTKDVEAKEEEQYFERVRIVRYNYLTKMAVSKKEGDKEAIYVMTNGKVEDGIKNYSYRFGSIVWLTILGVEYTSNIEKRKNEVKIRCYRKNKEKQKERIFSLFNTGLMYFNLCFNSYQVTKIRCNFLLYEI